MSVSDDIGNLFQRFGGNPDRYQEVARDDEAKHAASRWPLLSALDIAHPEQVPGAGRPAPAMSPVQPLSAVPVTRPAEGGALGTGAQPAATRAPDEAKQAPDAGSATAA
ncbi:MAG TPA: cellulose biosynthesis protein BcsP, partial [Paraburkholderia sp.]